MSDDPVKKQLREATDAVQGLIKTVKQAEPLARRSDIGRKMLEETLLLLNMAVRLSEAAARGEKIAIDALIEKKGDIKRLTAALQSHLKKFN
jgi:hypothetical protein